MMDHRAARRSPRRPKTGDRRWKARSTCRWTSLRTNRKAQKPEVENPLTLQTVWIYFGVVGAEGPAALAVVRSLLRRGR